LFKIDLVDERMVVCIDVKWLGDGVRVEENALRRDGMSRIKRDV
jgi:hypothetical protein